MRSGFEQPKANESAAESEQEFKWVYTSSVPAEAGRPDVQLVLGVPQQQEWLRRDEADHESNVYSFELPVNFVAGADTARMTIKGEVEAGAAGEMRLVRSSLA